MTKEILLTGIFSSVIMFVIFWKIQSKYDLYTWWFALIGMFVSVAVGEIVIYLLSL